MSTPRLAGSGNGPTLTCGSPADCLNPSYWSLSALSGLASLTGNPQWRRVAESAVTVTRRLTLGGRLLPPDWAELTAAGQLRAEPAPNGSQPQTQYGLDAQRTIVWFAASCDRRAKALAARWWGLLRPGQRSQALALRPDGDQFRTRGAAAGGVRCRGALGRGRGRQPSLAAACR